MRRKGKWTRIHREYMNPYMFDGVRCEACTMCFGLPTPYCPNCGAKMQDNEDFEVGILIEVVRCKDCKYEEQCHKWIKFKGVDLDHRYNNLQFCSYGERKTDD